MRQGKTTLSVLNPCRPRWSRRIEGHHVRAVDAGANPQTLDEAKDQRDWKKIDKELGTLEDVRQEIESLRSQSVDIEVEQIYSKA